ncbi:hypothetical protein O3M35_001310 [Rhynocoris fuscipes]|uniref:Uncharacterized protein n=1 Tax=Rhynocoris fuscipes TaxID=488301 RepID=A0AAW1DTM1_9HEMI
MMLKVSASLLVLASLAFAKVKYDQSQTGDYNVHLDLKNIEIVAILDDTSFSNNEYDYDYGEMTLKPTANVTEPTNVTAVTKPNENSGIDSQSASTNHTTNGTPSPIGSSTTASSKPIRRCGAGFFRDVNGRCRRQRRPNMKLDELLHQAKHIFGRRHYS